MHLRHKLSAELLGWVRYDSSYDIARLLGFEQVIVVECVDECLICSRVQDALSISSNISLHIRVYSPWLNGNACNVCLFSSQVR